MYKILIVEDDKSFGYLMSEYLMLKEYHVIWKENSAEAIKSLMNSDFDLVILDVNLKHNSGYDIARQMIKERMKIPFIFLTARDLKIDQLKGYKLGAEEYVTKPIDEEILLAKIEAILTRKSKTQVSPTEYTFENIKLLIPERALFCDRTKFQLSEKECLLMESFISQPLCLVERDHILRKLWNNKDEFSRNSMDVYISRLRKYLSNTGKTIRNVHSKGFILENIKE